APLDRTERRDARRVDLRARPGGAEPTALRPAVFQGGFLMITYDKLIFSLNGREVAAEPGETIFQAARREGVDLPPLCYSSVHGYRPDGNCRACVVEVAGERVLA